MLIESKIQEYISQQRRLLELELRSEQDENDYHGISKRKDEDDGTGTGTDDLRSNRILSNLHVENLGVGLLGRTVVTFVPPSSTASTSTNTQTGEGNDQVQEPGFSNDKKTLNTSCTTVLLPAHRLTVGDEVEIVALSQLKINQIKSSKSTSSKRNQAGVVSEVTDTSISVALYDNNYNNKVAENKRSQSKKDSKVKKKIISEADPSEEGSKSLNVGSEGWLLVPRSSIQVHQKMLSILDRLGKNGANHDVAGRVISNIFQSNTKIDKEEEMHCYNSGTTFKPFNPNLDENQKEAIQFALNGNQPVSLIHGPPGTGEIEMK